VDLREGEQLIRVHRFRFVKAQGCGLGGVDLVVEEALGPVPPETPRCTARPEHPELVPKPEFTRPGDTVDEAVEHCLEAIRPRRFYELFLPKA
jgi:hypothetical protein